MDTPTPPATSSTKQTVPTAFPSIKETFSLPVEYVKKAFKNLVLISLAGLAVWMTAAIAFFAIVLGSALSFSSAMNSDEVTASIIESLANASSVTTIALLLVVFFAAAISVGMLFQLATLKALMDAEKNPSFGSLFNFAKSKFWPYLGVYTLLNILVLGAMGLFIIPGIVISVLLGFALYAVLFSEDKPVMALRTSYTLVSKNFGDLLVRWALFVLLAIGVSMVPSIVAETIPSLESLMALLSMIINAVLGWYGLAFGLVLYKHATHATVVTEPKKITWMWVVAIIGWVMMFFIGTVVTKGIMTAYQDFSDGGDAYQKMLEMSDEAETPYDSEFYESETMPQDQETLDEMQAEYEKALEQLSPEEREAFEMFMKAAQEQQ